jgi:23S rRNA pseudouridine2605 synthase
MGDRDGPPPGTRVIAFHKPKALVVTRADEHGRKTVYDLLPAWFREDGWVPVGRLDVDSRGLLLFVQEGWILDRLTRPGACPKRYEVWVRGRVTAEHVAACLAGVTAGVDVLQAVAVDLVGGVGPKSRVLVTLDEGRNRHVRRMFGALRDPGTGTPLKVLDLRRISIGPLDLDLPSGEWRALDPAETRRLLAAVGV